MPIMNTLASVLISLFVATICVGCAIGDSNAKVMFTKIDVKVNNNPYYDTWSSEIHSSGQQISLKMPTKADVPDSMRIKGTIEFNGDVIGDVDMTVCEAFDDDAFGKDVVDAGVPKDKFPKNCPIKANKDLMVSKYMVPPEKIPDGLPDGIIKADIAFYEEGKDPIITIKAEADLIHE